MYRKWEKEYGVPAELYADLRSIKTTMANNWHKEIFNYFDEDGRKTNAIAEATNAFIERMVINGYSFKRLRARALYWHDASPRTRYVFESRKQIDTGSKGFFTSGSSFNFIDVYGIYEDKDPVTPGKHGGVNFLSDIEHEEISGE